MPTTRKKGRISKLASCIRRTAATTSLKRKQMINSPLYSKADFVPEMSGKFTALIDKIRSLDALDMRDHGTNFKHFIFTDVRESSGGAKALAAYLIAAGFDLRQGRAEKYVKRGNKQVRTKTGATVFQPLAAPVTGGSNAFALLQSAPLWKNPVTVETKRAILRTFNSRPDNVNGELLRIIVLDSKYKEGIDLFDVKYVHLLEPAIAPSDLKQAVGRATRFCGQRGLHFVPRRGWPLQVYIYNTELPNRAPFGDGASHQKVDAHVRMLEASGLDLALLQLTKELTVLAIQTAVDYDLTYNINNFDIEAALLDASAPATPSPATVGGATPATPPPSPASTYFSPPASAKRRTPKIDLAAAASLDFAAFQAAIRTLYAKYKWQSPIVKNGCTESALVAPGRPVAFTQTQDFVRHYLTPASPFKGLLAWHSVGTGKTCMAVAAATTEFERAGYTILWVTRNALMADVYKNIFGSVCSIPMMEQLEAGAVLPAELAKQKRLLSRAWLPPISYRMFQNALEKKNALGRTLYANSPDDPLRKTILIMDEVHKLQDGDLSAAEAADFATIRNYIWKSYDASGDASVRPLLMTATPITDSPRDLFELLNCLLPSESQRLMAFDAFRKTYTTDDGAILPAGKTYFQERAKGLISYLNREYDPSTFAQPVFHTVRVPVGEARVPTVDELADTCLAGVETHFRDDGDVDADNIDDLKAEMKHEMEHAKRGEKAAIKAAYTQRIRAVTQKVRARRAAIKTLINGTKACYTKQKREFTRKNRVSQLTAMETCFGKPVKRTFVNRGDFLDAIQARITPSTQTNIRSYMAVRDDV